MQPKKCCRVYMKVFSLLLHSRILTPAHWTFPTFQPTSYLVLFALWQVPKAMGMSVAHYTSFRYSTNYEQSSTLLNVITQSTSQTIQKMNTTQNYRRRERRDGVNSESNFCLLGSSFFWISDSSCFNIWRHTVEVFQRWSCSIKLAIFLYLCKSLSGSA